GQARQSPALPPAATGAKAGLSFALPQQHRSVPERSSRPRGIFVFLGQSAKPADKEAHLEAPAGIHSRRQRGGLTSLSGAMPPAHPRARRSTMRSAVRESSATACCEHAATEVVTRVRYKRLNSRVRHG